MPAQTKKASFGAKFGNQGKAAAAEAAKAPVDYGRRELPPGITNGVARLVNAEMQELDKDTGWKQLDGSSAAGQLVLVLTAVADTPKAHPHNGAMVKVEGMQFKKFCNLFQRGVKGDFGAEWDFNECVKQATNEMKKIAGEWFDTTDFDAAVAALANTTPKPRFHFSTVMGKVGTKIDPKTGKPYEPRLNVYWNGAAPDADADPGAGVDDGTGAAHAGANGQAFTADVDGSGDGTVDPADDVNEYDWDAMTLAEIAEVADSEGEPAEGSPAHEAQARLSEQITEAGLGEDWVTQFDSWGAIAEALEAAQAEPEPEPEPAPAPKPRPAPRPAAKPAPAPAKAPAKPVPAPAKKPAPAPARKK